MSEKTLIQQHAEALEQIKKLTGEREASAKLLEESAKAHRNPPGGWEAKVAKLAKQRAERLARLAERLEAA